MQGHEHYWNLTMYDICVLYIHKLSQKKQLQKPSQMVPCFDTSLAIARRVLTENKLIFVFIDVLSGGCLDMSTGAEKVQMKHALKLTAT